MGRLLLILIAAAAIAAVLKVVLIGVAVALGIILIYGFLTRPKDTIVFILGLIGLSIFFAHPYIILALAAVFFLYLRHQKSKGEAQLTLPFDEPTGAPADPVS